MLVEGVKLRLFDMICFAKHARDKDINNIFSSPMAAS